MVNGERHIPHPSLEPPCQSSRQPVKNRRERITQENQATFIQRFTFDSIMSLKEALTGEDGKLRLTREDAMAIAQLGKTWDTARDAVRILRGKGLPASVKSKPAKSAPPAEPIQPA